MTQHTPGPWASSHPLHMDAAAHRVEKIFVHGAGKAIASLSDYRMEPGEAWANARLLAAAPELLDALQIMLGTAGEEMTPAQRLPIMDKARAAIAKATGAAQ